jgi:hypothetical protein
MPNLLFAFGDGGGCALLEALSLGCITNFGFAFALPFALADTCDCVGGMLGGGGMLDAWDTIPLLGGRAFASGPSDAGTSSLSGGGALACVTMETQNLAELLAP